MKVIVFIDGMLAITAEQPFRPMSERNNDPRDVPRSDGLYRSEVSLIIVDEQGRRWFANAKLERVEGL